MMTHIRRAGWFVVELALLLVILCVLLNIILGTEGSSFITQVAANATNFLQHIPPGTFLGVVLILVLAWMFRARGS